MTIEMSSLQQSPIAMSGDTHYDEVTGKYYTTDEKPGESIWLQGDTHYDEVTGKCYTTDEKTGESIWLQEKLDVTRLERLDFNFVRMNTHTLDQETTSESMSGVVEVVIENVDDE